MRIFKKITKKILMLTKKEISVIIFIMFSAHRVLKNGVHEMAFSNDKKIVDNISEEIINKFTDMIYTKGVNNVTVKDILKEMDMTNRVFYNRFQNIEEVFSIVRQRLMDRTRKCIDEAKYDGKSDYCDYLTSIAISVIEQTYENKVYFSGYTYENDELNNSYRQWWIEKITELIRYGIDIGVFRDVNVNLMSYSVWCYCRSFNSCSVGDNLSTQDALLAFKMGFECLMRGLKSDKIAGAKT